MKLVFSLCLLLFMGCHLKTTPQVDVVVIGTAHGKHIGQNYPLDIFKNIIHRNSMDLVLIEISNSHLNRDKWDKAPPEMAYIYHYAHEKKIPVIGIDAETELKEEDNLDPEIRNVHVNLHENMGVYSFQKLNSDKILRKLESLKNTKAMSLKNRIQRQDEILKNIVTHIKKTKAKKIFVFVGYKHRYALISKMPQNFRIISPLTVFKDPSHLSSEVIPEDVKAKWQGALKEIQKNPDEDNQSAKQSVKKEELFKAFLAL